jgi:hypothetical protein
MGRQGGAKFCAGVMALAGATAWCAGEVTVDKKPVVVERKTFDSAHRPAEMPPLDAGEAAVTESRFDCAAELTYKVIDRNPTNSGCTTTLRVQSVHLTITLKVVVWLPVSAPNQLTAHEEGHKQIDQRIYDEAKSIAEGEGKLIDGRVVDATAADCAAAENKATQSAAENVCKRYLKSVGQMAERINQRYDDLTSHGTRISPAPEKAVEQAFECERPKP